MTFPLRICGGSLALLAGVLVASGGDTAPQSAASSKGARAFTRPTTPRMQPVPASEWGDAHREALGRFGRGEQTPDAFKICLHNVELCRSWVPFVAYTAGNSKLSRRDSELLILRTAWLCHDDYVWSEHSSAATRAGLTADEILRIAKNPQAKEWSRLDAALLAAADQLHADQFIQDATWESLAAHYDKSQLLDVIFTVGQYSMVSMYLNSVGVRMLPAFTGLPR